LRQHVKPGSERLLLLLLLLCILSLLLLWQLRRPLLKLGRAVLQCLQAMGVCQH
jgi:hypothetical protein